MAPSPLGALVAFSAVLTTYSYCSPGDACWPDEAAWAGLEASLEGDLYAVDASKDYDECEKCDSDAYCISAAAHGICMHAHACAHEFCQEQADWDVGDRVVAVASAADVSAALAFANAHDLAVSVKTTGHSYTGSSTAKGSLLVWTRGLPTLGAVTEGPWTGSSCGDAVDAAATLEIGGGATWSDAYAAVGND